MYKETIKSIERLGELIPSWLGRDYAVDCETSGLDHFHNRLLGVSVTFGDNEDSYYVCFEHNEEDWQGNPILINFIDRPQGMNLLRAVFSQPEVFVATFNAKFEIHEFAKYDVPLQGRLFDGLLCAQLLDENRSNGLKSLAPLVGMKYDKYQERVKYAGYTKHEILGVPLAEAADYAMDDSIATWRLCQMFKEELGGTTFQNVFYDVWMPLMVTLQAMEKRGTHVNKEMVSNLLEEHTTMAQGFEQVVLVEGLKMLSAMKPEEIPDLYLRVATPEELASSFEADDGYQKIAVGDVSLPLVEHHMKGKTVRWATRIPVFNTGSDKQLIDLLYGYMCLLEIELPFSMKTTAGGDISVDRDNIQTLIFAYGEHCPEVLKALLSWRKSEKFANTYLKQLLELPDEDDRIHTTFSMAVSDHGGGGTATGRLSSSRVNLQNVPSQGEVGKQARQIYDAEDGMLLLVSDYSNLELRILGHFSKDPSLVTAFSENLDLHSMTAANQNNIDYAAFVSEIDNKNPLYEAMRRVGKVSNFGLAYGMGPAKFQRYLLTNSDTFVDIKEATKLIQGYNDTFAVAGEWKQRVYQYAQQLGFVRTLAGRHRRLPDLYSKDRYIVMRAQRQAVNAIIQGSAADVIMEAMPVVHNALKAIGGGLLMQVHDELVAEVPERNAEMGIKLMDCLMVDMANQKLRVPLVAEAHAGHTWAGAKS